LPARAGPRVVPGHARGHRVGAGRAVSPADGSRAAHAVVQGEAVHDGRRRALGGLTVPALKTYSHLAGRRRMPIEYQLVTTQLLYHPARGLEVEVPLGAWYRRHLAGSPLRCSDWEQFEDPRATTYASYTALQSRQESHVEGVLRSIDSRDYDRQLPAGAL